ncbi:MAG: NACHT domain-containing protein, partial [Thermoflexales bacterium]|nr:NACHT domain-containing protein [Thermoflexales bacterium]
MRSRAQGQGQKRKALVKAGIQMVAQGQQCTERAARVFIYTHTALSPDMLRDWSERGRKTSIGVGDLSLFARVCLANAPKNIRPDWLVRWADDLFDVNDLGRRDMSPELQQVVQKLDLSVTQPPDNPLSLYEYLDHASQVLEQVRALGSAPGSGPRFVGRGWLEARVDDWLGDPARRSGVFVLVGGAGVGKTAFLAHLVLRREQEKDKRKRYLHVFAGQFPHEANVSYAIQLLAAQIVDHYDLRDYGRRDTLVELSSTPDFLERLLRMAAKTLARDEKIVVVCDALDEAGHGANGNVLGLPTRLPDGVYLVLSHRPVPVALHIDDPAPLSFELKPDDANNLRDIQDYLTGVARQAEVASLLGGREDGERTFIQSLMDKSQGNWMYLHHVVNQVRRGERDPLDLAGLPGGLVSYYARYWCDWREGRNRRGEGPAQWDRLYGPLLATLAVAQERVSVEELVTWTGVDAGPAAVRRLLREKWRDHVEERNGGEGGERYGVYHTSFRDFISGQVDLAGLSPAARYLLDDLKERCGEMHKRIVAHYRRQCSGEWLKLVGEEYARRHLAYHLYHAGDGEALYELVTGSSAWAEARYEIEESYAGYLADLELAWQWAESEGAWDIGRQVRCALVASSLGSLGKGVEPWLVARLVASGIWSAARALAYVQAIEDEQGRSDGLVRLAPFLSEGLAVQALAMAREMRDTGRRARALGELIERVPAEQRLEVAGEVLAAMQTIVDREMASPGMGYRAIGGGQPQIQVLGELVGYLPGDLRDKAAPEVLKVVREKGTPVTRAWVLGRLAKRLNSGDLVDEALAAAREPDNRTERVQALSDLADHVPAGLQEQIIREALAVAQKGGGLSWRAGPLVTVVRHMPKQLKAELLPGVLARVRKMQDRFDRADALCALACHMPPDAPVEGDTPLEVARQAWELVDKLSFEYRYFEGWGEMVSCLPADLKVKALAAARRLPNVLERVKALADIAWYWPGELAGATSRSLLAEALAEARSIGDHWASVQSVCALSEHVPDELQAALANRALAAARQVADEKKRVDALCQVAAQWPAVLGRDILLEALAVARGLDAGLRWKVCQEVIDRLPAEDKAPAAREMLADAVEARDDYLRGRDLAWDVETVPDAEADAMWDMLSGYELAMVLPLAEHLPDEEKAE